LHDQDLGSALALGAGLSDSDALEFGIPAAVRLNGSSLVSDGLAATKLD
jgi:hypothetical protein